MCCHLHLRDFKTHFPGQLQYSTVYGHYFNVPRVELINVKVESRLQ